MKELLYLKDDHLKECIEKLFMGYRESFGDAKKILDKYSIGIAHHKVIHLLSMYEGISISILLKKLKITKQSLNRVLKDISIAFHSSSSRVNRFRLKTHLCMSENGKKIFNDIPMKVIIKHFNSTSDEFII